MTYTADSGDTFLQGVAHTVVTAHKDKIGEVLTTERGDIVFSILITYNLPRDRKKRT